MAYLPEIVYGTLVRGLLRRAKYGRGLALLGRYGSHEGLPKTLKRLPNGALVKLGGPITHQANRRDYRNHRKGSRFYTDPTSGQITHRLESSIIQNHYGQIPHQDRKSHLHPVLCTYKPNEADKDAKAALYERLPGVIDGVARKDLPLLLGDLNAKLGSDNTSFETVMGKYGIGKINENGELFADFCSFNKLVVGGSIFPHKKVHKTTWVSPDIKTDNQIDSICIASKFRRSLLDVRVKIGADVASDHHVLVGRCRLKLKYYHMTCSQKTSHKYNIEMLKDGETKNWFQLTLSNKYQALASLRESEQHPREEESNTVVNQVWQRMKKAWRETCEDTLGRKSKQHKAHVSTDTLKK
ncbi:craniofacial development protein 2-like [Orbicella faveolata]|uniref:craniofacial development protein 2-like n=1 Tax=Orbicella faveolata TaxID=48498 RepID=UPI0009E5EEAC|nr:craniofacial development protein 2-like [Orbicella faveolata]